MKSISKIFVAASTLVLAGNIFAATAADCPPIATIAETQFAKSTLYQGDIWILTSNNFSYLNKEWNTSFGLHVPTQSPDDALIEGQKYFKTNVTLNMPEVQEESGFTVCIYANEFDQYGVFSANPPIEFGGGSQFKSTFAKTLK